MKIQATEYQTEDGKRPFSKWIKSVNIQAQLKLTTAIRRLEQDNFSSVKPVGNGVSEYRLNFGPGYRIYFGMDGAELIILLAGGTKNRQSNDIKVAKEYWKKYKSDKG